jgi:uncharacterized phage protein (TIGR01671 family)
MKDIRFRVWDLLEKKMFQWEEIFDLPAWEIFPSTPEQRAFEAMQYTGLKDCKGVRIFEGDIVSAILMEGQAYIENEKVVSIKEVCVEKIIGKVDFNKEKLMYWLYWNKSSSLGCYTDIEIIGNIWENKDLLNENPS